MAARDQATAFGSSPASRAQTECFAVAEAGMADEALARCVSTLSAVFIFGGDIMRAEDPGHLGGLGWRSLRGLERDKTGPMPSYERVQAGSCRRRMNPRLLLIPSG